MTVIWGSMISFALVLGGAAAGREIPATVIEIHPADAPTPALKYRLEREFRSLRPGNAAVYYHRAVILLAEQHPLALRGGARTSSPRAYDPSLVREWMNCELKEFPAQQVRERLRGVEPILSDVERGAECDSCDWGLDQRENFISLPFPEIQQLRPIMQLLVLKARLALVESRTEDAVKAARTMFALGRHLGESPSLITALVGISGDSMMMEKLRELIQRPGTPSLYWSLIDLRRPLIDWKRSMEGEKYLLESEIPELAKLDGKPWSLEETRGFARALEQKIFDLDSGGFRGEDRSAAAALRQLGLAAICAKIYPQARQVLIDQGRSAADVDAMPITQASSLYSYLEYQRRRDESFKWLSVPYWQSYNRPDSWAAATVAKKLANPLLTLFLLLEPGLHSARTAFVRLERKLDVLICLEAIRLHAAKHGALPDSLESITDAPVPFDPATGKPFEYIVSGDTAELGAPYVPGGPRHHEFAEHYQLKLVR